MPPSTRPQNDGPKAATRMPQDRGPVPPMLDQTFDAGGLFRLRSAVAAHAAELGAGEAVYDVVLIAHELSSNAVRHGGGTGRLRLWVDADRIMCRVSDSGPGLVGPAGSGADLPSPQVPGGRGLWIVHRLSTVGIDTGPSGTTITSAIPLPSMADRDGSAATHDRGERDESAEGLEGLADTTVERRVRPDRAEEGRDRNLGVDGN
jgi:anti-sigma regulatory factor (Ser/Thr protein kinase)